MQLIKYKNIIYLFSPFILIFAIIISLTQTALSESNEFIDGRTYYIKLAKVLKLDQNSLRNVFDEIKIHLPQNGAISDLRKNFSGIAQLAVSACTDFKLFTNDYVNIDQLYEDFFQRKPTKQERKEAFQGENGQFHSFENCVFLSLHPEFISLPKR